MRIPAIHEPQFYTRRYTSAARRFWSRPVVSSIVLRSRSSERILQHFCRRYPGFVSLGLTTRLVLIEWEGEPYRSPYWLQTVAVGVASVVDDVLAYATLASPAEPASVQWNLLVEETSQAIRNNLAPGEIFVVV